MSVYRAQHLSTVNSSDKIHSTGNYMPSNPEKQLQRSKSCTDISVASNTSFEQQVQNDINMTKREKMSNFIHATDIITLKKSINNALDELAHKSIQSGLCVELSAIPKLLLNVIENNTGEIDNNFLSDLKFFGGSLTQFDSMTVDDSGVAVSEGEVGNVVETMSWDDLMQEVNDQCMEDLFLSHDYNIDEEISEDYESYISRLTSEINNSMSDSEVEKSGLKDDNSIAPGNSTPVQPTPLNFPPTSKEEDNVVSLADIPRLISKIMSKLRENCDDYNITFDIEKIPEYIHLIREEAVGEETEVTSGVRGMKVSVALLPKLIQKAMKRREKLSGGTVDEMIAFIQETMEAEEAEAINSQRHSEDPMTDRKQVQRVDDVNKVEGVNDDFVDVEENVEGDLSTRFHCKEIGGLHVDAVDDLVSEVTDELDDAVSCDGVPKLDLDVSFDCDTPRSDATYSLSHPDVLSQTDPLNDVDGVPKLDLDVTFDCDTPRSDATYSLSHPDVLSQTDPLNDVDGVPKLGDDWLREIRRATTQERDDERASTALTMDVAAHGIDDESDSDVEILTVVDDRYTGSYSEGSGIGSEDEEESSRRARVNRSGRAMKGRKRRRRRRQVNSAKQRLTPWLLACLCEDLLDDYSKLKEGTTRPFTIESHRDYDCLTLNHCQVLFDKQRLWRRAEQLHSVETSRRRAEKTTRRLDAIRKTAVAFSERWDRVARSCCDVIFDAKDSSTRRSSEESTNPLKASTATTNLRGNVETMMDVLERNNTVQTSEKRTRKGATLLAPANSRQSLDTLVTAGHRKAITGESGNCAKKQKSNAVSSHREPTSRRFIRGQGRGQVPTPIDPTKRKQRREKKTKKKNAQHRRISLEGENMTARMSPDVREKNHYVENTRSLPSYPCPGGNYRHYMKPTMASAMKRRGDGLPCVVSPVASPVRHILKRKPKRRLIRRATAPEVPKRQKVTWKRSLHRTAPERQFVKQRSTPHQETTKKHCAFKTSSVRYVVKRFERPWPCPFFDPNPIYCLEEVDSPRSSENACSERALLDAVASASPSPRKKGENLHKKSTMSENNLREYLPTSARVVKKFLSSRKLSIGRDRRWDWGSNDDQRVIQVKHVSPYVKATTPPKRRMMRGKMRRRLELLKEELSSRSEDNFIKRRVKLT